MPKVKTVLFVCVHNSGRSQMAEAFFNQYFSPNRVIASSAGTQPAGGVNPLVVIAMKEKGIDISYKSPKMLTLEMLESADRVISMGCGIEQFCPANLTPMGGWQIDNPEGKSLDEIRSIRDQIEKLVRQFIKDL
jgi:arsenate reductase (thioredoxin)